MYTFNSSIEDRGSFQSVFPTEVIKREPMFFNSGLSFAYEKGGALTRSFIDSLPKDWKYSNPVLDSRLHMLMPGWYPAIPGYHHDDVPRSTGSGQPNYDTPEYHSDHLIGLVNGHLCPTLFALGTHQLPKVDSGIIYKTWHPLVEKQIDNGILIPYIAPSGTYIQFNCHSMHTVQKAVENGWRWFVRLSKNTNRQKNITNEIRNQVQVYLEFPMEGW